MEIELNGFAAEVHKNAVEHGWWDAECSFGEIIALCHSELSEALEEYRADRGMLWRRCTCADGKPCAREGCGDWEDGVCELNALGDKPEGVAVELADCILRILDYLGKAGADVDALVESAKEDILPLDSGLKFGVSVAEWHATLSLAYRQRNVPGGAEFFLAVCINELLDWAQENGVDIRAVLALKHAYNKSRPYRHGGKVL